MQATPRTIDVKPAAASAEILQSTGWEVDRDIIRGRSFDFGQKFLPDAMSRLDGLEFLDGDERRLLSQVQGWTYGNLFGMFEHVVSAKLREMRSHSRGNRAAAGKVVQIVDEGLKHRELFRRIDTLIAKGMPPGYRFLPKTDDFVEFVLARSTWAVLALIHHIELQTQVHYRQSIVPDAQLSHLYKDVFFFHWKQKSQRGAFCERDWKCEDARLSAAERDRAVNDWIELVQGVDSLLMLQAPADVAYFAGICRRTFTTAELERLATTVLCAYRWQYLVSVAQESRFGETLGKLVGAHRAMRIAAELAPIMQSGAQPRAGKSSQSRVASRDLPPAPIAESLCK